MTNKPPRDLGQPLTTKAPIWNQIKTKTNFWGLYFQWKFKPHFKLISLQPFPVSSSVESRVDLGRNGNICPIFHVPVETLKKGLPYVWPCFWHSKTIIYLTNILPKMLIYKLCWCYIVNYCLRELHHPSLLFESMDTFSYWKVWQRDSLQNVLVRAKRKGCFRISQEDDHCVIVKTFLTGKSWHRDDF